MSDLPDPNTVPPDNSDNTEDQLRPSPGQWNGVDMAPRSLPHRISSGVGNEADDDADSEDDGEAYDTDSDDYPAEEMEPLAHPSTWEGGIRLHQALSMIAERDQNNSPATAPQSQPQPHAGASNGDEDDEDDGYCTYEEEDYTDEEVERQQVLSERRQRLNERPRSNIARAPQSADRYLQQGGGSGGPRTPAELPESMRNVFNARAHQSLAQGGANQSNSFARSVARNSQVAASEQVVQTGHTSMPGEHVTSSEEGASRDNGPTLRSNHSEDNGTEATTTNQESGGIQPLGAAATPRANHTPGFAPGTPVALGAPQQSQAESTPASGPVSLPLRPGNSSRPGSSSPPREVPSTSPPPRAAPATPPPPEVVLPRWQPDAEVTLCPICGTQFSFFVRKHHCRKCGRVVCNSCSPHRITIPYQFIVQPPDEFESPRAPARYQYPASIHSSPASTVANLGGGERVRLCNPCVPDPNTAPPQSPDVGEFFTSPPSRTHTRSSSLADSYLEALGRRPADDPEERLRANRSGTFHSPPHPHAVPGYYTRANSGRWGQSPDRRSTVSFLGVPVNDPMRAREGIYADEIAGGAYGLRPHLQPGQGRPIPHRDPNSPRASLPGSDRNPDAEAAAPQQDDSGFCPVCHVRMPTRSIDPEALERLREAHVRECIEAAIQGSSSTPPVPVIPVSVPRGGTGAPSSSLPTTSSHAAASSSSSTPAPTGPSMPAAAGFAAPSSPRRTGIFPYQATEKDCVDSAECTICFEDFVVGAEMARLECFCRFHRACIMRWFKKRPGHCPVHQHGSGGQ